MNTQKLPDIGSRVTLHTNGLKTSKQVRDNNGRVITVESHTDFDGVEATVVNIEDVLELRYSVNVTSIAGETYFVPGVLLYFASEEAKPDAGNPYCFQIPVDEEVEHAVTMRGLGVDSFVQNIMATYQEPPLAERLHRLNSERHALEMAMVSGAASVIASNPENAAEIAGAFLTVLNGLRPIPPEPTDPLHKKTVDKAWLAANMFPKGTGQITT